MASRLEAISNNMDPSHKLGCGAIFMVILLFIIWIISYFTYHTIWLHTVGKEEYRDTLSEVKDIREKLRLLEVKSQKFEENNTALTQRTAVLEEKIAAITSQTVVENE